MSQPKLTLRPPPNVDFVQGYPGIPPGPPDRPQAAVKGAIELRVPPQGVKAKWVRIELRKVEMLPGGGLQNTFFDFVGQSPINLWQSGDEYANLITQDFPFYIRIPESIPPSITLDKGAGIKYELIATVCVREKKGFFRRDKSKVLNTSSVIVIDKHELHSTWPVYTQPDSRSISQDGVTLTVDRTHTCYGPGDRIAVDATVKSESLQTVVLRGFSFALKETIVFRAGPNVTGKKGAPQVKVGNVAEQNVPVNATIYGGQMHKAVLAVTLPAHHTSTTLNSARHIDITYVLVVKALMGSGKPLSMDLPVIISNWPRSVSVEAVSRIGLASNVASHLAQQAPPSASGRSDDGPLPVPGSKRAQMAEAQRLASQAGAHPYLHPAPAAPPTTITDSSSEPATDLPRPAGNFNTAPVPSTGYSKTADEFGFNKSAEQSRPQIQTIGATPTPTASGIMPTPAFLGDTTPRPRSSAGRQGTQQRTFSVMNYADDMPEEVAAQVRAQAQAAAARQRSVSHANRPAVSGTMARSGWATAEEEKKRLYDDAVKKVAEVQGISPPQSPPILSPVPVRDNTLSVNALTSSKPSSAWPSAEEEKARLFNEARERVAQTQGIDGLAGNGSPSQNRASGSTSLYAGPVASVARATSTSSAINIAANSTPAPKPSRHFPSAEEEKAALARRFAEARAAVDRNQAVAFGSGLDGPSQPMVASPISYEALYPPAQGSSRDPGPNDLPPAFDYASSSQEPMLSEKERMRRAFEERDRALLAQRQATSSSSSSGAPSYQEAMSSSPQLPTSTISSYNSSSSLSEKERVRRYFEEQDAARMGGSPPMPPPRSATSTSGRNLPTPRAQPVPPGGSPSSRLLSAAEEKARLAAMYASDERSAAPPSSPPLFPTPQLYPNSVNGHVNGNGHAVRSGSIGSLNMNGHVSRQSSVHTVDYTSIPPPPPLMPRPPKEYIEETQEEDQAIAAKIEAMDNDSGVSLSNPHDPPLELRPFTPFVANFEAQRQSAFPPPPLPPKVPVVDA